MAAEPAYQPHPWEIPGHPKLELVRSEKPPIVVSVCAACGHMRTVLFLTKDRWMCFRCKTEGNAPPNLYPVS